MGVPVVDHAQGQTRTHVRDYEAFMEGLRNGTLKHTGDRDLRAHVLNAIARRLPGGDLRFDRPNPSRRAPGAQDRRVIDGLTAAAMVVEFSNNAEPAGVCLRGERAGGGVRFRITRQKALTGSPSFVEALRGGQVDMIPRLGGSNINLQRISSVFVQAQSASYAFMYQTQPAVRSVVDYVASNIAQLGLRLYERVDDDEREYAGDHPACESLRWPNERTPGQQFVYNLVADFLVYDNSYALKFKGPVPAGRCWGSRRRPSGFWGSKGSPRRRTASTAPTARQFRCACRRDDPLARLRPRRTQGGVLEARDAPVGADGGRDCPGGEDGARPCRPDAEGVDRAAVGVAAVVG